jgi:uncharacterized surface protein with fasciclin (FAS1) repeats
VITTNTFPAVTLTALASNSVIDVHESVLDFIADNPDHHLFIEVAAAVGFDELLENSSGFTVFLPTDDALEEAALDINLGETLSPDEKEYLTEFLANHIVDDEISSHQLDESLTIETLGGLPVSIDHSLGTITVNDSSLLVPDIVAENGVVHVIDTVLTPGY